MNYNSLKINEALKKYLHSLKRLYGSTLKSGRTALLVPLLAGALQGGCNDISKVAGCQTRRVDLNQVEYLEQDVTPAGEDSIRVVDVALNLNSQGTEYKNLLAYQVKLQLAAPLPTSATYTLITDNAWPVSVGLHDEEVTLSRNRKAMKITISAVDCIPRNGNGLVGKLRISAPAGELPAGDLVREADGFVLVENIDVDLDDKNTTVLRRLP